MPRRFLVATSNVGKVAERKLTAFFERNDIQWWHWLPNTWMIVSAESRSTRALTKEIGPLLGEAEFFVMDVSGRTEWHGRFTEAEKVSEWLIANWGGEDA